MRTLIFTLALILPASALAAPDEVVVREMARRTKLSFDEIMQNYDACDSGVTLSMKICGSYHWIAQDIRLNKIYRQALVKAKEFGYDRSLIEAQRSWITYRDTACRYEGEMGAGGGSAEGLYVLTCKEYLTKQRADRLAESLKE